MSGADDPDALREHVVDALLVLANVGYGDLDRHVEVRVPAETPLGALLTGINEMIDALRAARDRNQAIQAELEEKLATIEAQRAAIRELSTPVIEVWEGVLCLPVVGQVEREHAARMLDVLLTEVSARGTRCAIVDITALRTVGVETVEQLVRMARAVRLLGAAYVLTGVGPAVAQEMVRAGLDLQELRVFRSLREALRACVSGEL